MTTPYRERTAASYEQEIATLKKRLTMWHAESQNIAKIGLGAGLLLMAVEQGTHLPGLYVFACGILEATLLYIAWPWWRP